MIKLPRYWVYLWQGVVHSDVWGSK